MGPTWGERWNTSNAPTRAARLLWTAWRCLPALAVLALFPQSARAITENRTVSVLVMPFQSLDNPSRDRCQLDKGGWEQLQTAIDEAATSFGGDLIVNYPERASLTDILSEEATFQKLSPERRGLDVARRLKTKYMILTTYLSNANADRCRVDARLVEVETAAGITSKGYGFSISDENPLALLGIELVVELRKKLGMWVPRNTFRLVVECFFIEGDAGNPQTIKALARASTIDSLNGWGLKNLQIIPREDSYCESNLSVQSLSGAASGKDLDLTLIGRIISYSLVDKTNGQKTTRVRVSIRVLHNGTQVAAAGIEADESGIPDTVSKLLAKLKTQMAAPTFMQPALQGTQ